MAYFVYSDLIPLIPDLHATDSLDDDGNGVAEIFDGVSSAAHEFVDGVLSTRFAVPLTGAQVTAFIKTVTVHQAAFLCYGRRNLADAFPFKAQLESLLVQLRRIAEGKLPLAPEDVVAKPKGATKVGAVITGTAKTVSSNGRLAI